MTAFDCKKLVNTMLEACGLLAYKKANPEEITKWINLGKENIRNLRHLSLKNGNTAAEKQKFICAIGLLKGIQGRLKCLLNSGAVLRR